MLHDVAWTVAVASRRPPARPPHAAAYQTEAVGVAEATCPPHTARSSRRRAGAPPPPVLRTAPRRVALRGTVGEVPLRVADARTG